MELNSAEDLPILKTYLKNRPDLSFVEILIELEDRLFNGQLFFGAAVRIVR